MNNHLINHHFFILKLIRNMPKYAVAIGRKVGIFDTYEECKAQVNGFPGAKFKKFLTLLEAEEFIGKWSGSGKPIITPGKASSKKLSSNKVENKSVVPPPNIVENKSVPELTKVEKISPSNVPLNSLYQRLTHLEEKVDKCNSLIESLTSRVAYLEKRLQPDSINEKRVEPPPKRIKTELDDTSFLKSDKDVIMVYTDGACTNNGSKGAKAGIGVWFNHDHPLNRSAPVIGPATNNTAEIQAARVAIQVANEVGIKSLCVHTDSKFLINCISDWIHKWEKNGWQLSSGGPVKNKEEIVKLNEVIQNMEFIEWVYVTAHKGVEGNEMADKLAREGAVKYGQISSVTEIS